jgi:hypothetical protein
MIVPELSSALRRAQAAVMQAARNLEEAREILAAAEAASEANRKLLHSAEPEKTSIPVPAHD